METKAIEQETQPNAIAERIIDNVRKVIVGKDDAIKLGVVALITGGHILIEDVPGVGKTMLAKSMARSTGCTFSRIQFTPDMLPSDITGISIYNQKTQGFEFRPGPVIAQIVLADEINRATPKTQSALLEAMEENQITVEGVTHSLSQPFMIMATQNPIEYEGTFPLPEAQLDRFLLRINLGYPNFDDEISIMSDQQTDHPFSVLEAVGTPNEILELQKEARGVYVDQLVKQYIVTLSENTRNHTDVALGASPRASLSLFKASQSLALLNGRDFVLPDDVKELVLPIFSHRLILTASSRMQGSNSKLLIEEILEKIEVPGSRLSRRPKK
tara:strand:- start:2135 stop:3121 length:987 start_codon:yes stop_codon:yes gene_type:complete